MQIKLYSGGGATFLISRKHWPFPLKWNSFWRLCKAGSREVGERPTEQRRHDGGKIGGVHYPVCMSIIYFRFMLRTKDCQQFNCDLNCAFADSSVLQEQRGSTMHRLTATWPWEMARIPHHHVLTILIALCVTPFLSSSSFIVIK